MTEDALFQIQNLEEALNKNAQGILASTMKEEIKSLVKESLNEQEEVDDVDTEEDEDVVMIDDTEDVTEPMDDMDSAPMPPMDDMDDVEMDDDETIDLRGASDDEVVKVFKLMGDEDGIVVTKDDDSISIVDGEDEYLIKLNEEIENEMKETYNELDEWMNEEDESDIPSEADIDAELMTFMDNPNDSNDEDDDYEKESDEEESDEDDDYEKESDEEESDEEEVLYELHMDEEDIEAEGYDKELEEMSIDEELDMYEMMQNEEDDDAGFMNPDDEIKETAFSNELEENLYEIEFEEDDMEEAYLDEKMIDEYDMEEAYLEEGKKRKKSSVSRKGRTGNGPKFSYKKENVFFKSGPKQKEGKKDMGTGKPRYSWKEEVNMEGFTENPKEMKEASYRGEKLGLNDDELAFYDVQPPALTPDDPRYPGKDPRYADLSPDEIPLTERLEDTIKRFLPYWHQTIAPTVKAGKRVLICAHGNSLRALVKHLDNIADEEIPGLNIPTGVPLVYELEDNLTPTRNYYLGDPEAIKRAIQVVANQLKKNT